MVEQRKEMQADPAEKKARRAESAQTAERHDSEAAQQIRGPKQPASRRHGADTPGQFTAEPKRVTAASAVWIATATLHQDFGIAKSFTENEIIERADQQALSDVLPVTISLHVCVHCVANLNASPSIHRMLFQASKEPDLYRLFKEGDKFDPTRIKGKTAPLLSYLPSRYRYLRKWYYDEYYPKT